MHRVFAPLACRVILARGPRAAFKDSAQLSGTAPRRLRDSVTLTHPCQHAAAHLPCTRPPDALYACRPARPGARDRAGARAFVTTRAGTHTTARRGEEEDEIVAGTSVTSPTRPATIDAPAAVTTVAARRYHRVPQVALAAAPEALIAGLIATFQRRILRISLNASNFGASKASPRRLVSSHLCSTVTTWHPSKFSSKLAAQISATNAPTALLLKLLNASCARATNPLATSTTDCFFVCLYLHFCVLSVGSVHGLPLWRAVYMEGCSSVFSSWPDRLLFATRWSAPFIQRS